MTKKKSEFQKFVDTQRRGVNKVGKTPAVNDSTQRRFDSLKKSFDEAVEIGRRLEKQGKQIAYQKMRIVRLVEKIEKLK